jgi:peptidoglycan hydrolase CwlO-like protein
MANNERLTKRVKKIEEWLEENGSGPTLFNMNWLIEVIRNDNEQMARLNHETNTFRQLFAEFMEEKDLEQDWNRWLQEKDDAVQKQQAEEVSVQEEAESSEEAIEAQEEKE